MKFGIPNLKFKWETLYQIEFEIDIAFSALSSLNLNQEWSLNQTKVNLKKAIESIPVDERGSSFSYKFHEEEIIINELQRLQRYAIIISIFSFYESRLKSICNELESQFPSLKKHEEIKAKNDLLQMWKFLEKVFKLKTETLEPLFQPLLKQKKLRNVITHKDGKLPKSEKKEIQIISGISLKDIGKDYLIEVEENIFVNYLMKIMNAFFKELINVVDVRYKELKLENGSSNVA